jgi:hypothetical protein
VCWASDDSSPAPLQEMPRHYPHIHYYYCRDDGPSGCHCVDSKGRPFPRKVRHTKSPTAAPTPRPQVRPGAMMTEAYNGAGRGQG